MGGIIRGQATGNVFSLADASDIMHDRIQPQGLVKVYKSYTNIDIDLVKPNLVVKAHVTPTLAPILKTLSRKHSDPSSKLS